MRAAPFATEVDCGEAAGARSSNAFNNLCLHTFAPPAPAPRTCWAQRFDAARRGPAREQGHHTRCGGGGDDGHGAGRRRCSVL